MKNMYTRMKVALYTQKRDSETLSYLKRFIAEIEKMGHIALLHNQMTEEMEFSTNYSTFTEKKDIKEAKITYFFSFGGDGTILNALNFIQNLEIPVVGVNLGRLGFLASFGKEEIFDQLENIFSHKTHSYKRSVIQVVTPNKDIVFPYALNDITVSRKETTAMISIEAEINDRFLTTFWADGLIVATPTGSTAYSMSCGGPIIEPGNDNFTITPIAPHNLNVRPIVLKDNVEIKLKVSSRVPEYSLSLDSRLYHMNTEDKIIIRKANFILCMIFPERYSFYETLRQKLLWGSDKRN